MVNFDDYNNIEMQVTIQTESLWENLITQIFDIRKELDPYEFALFMAYLDHTPLLGGGIVLKPMQLRDETQMSFKKLNDARKRLEQKGFIEVEPPKNQRNTNPFPPTVFLLRYYIPTKE